MRYAMLGLGVLGILVGLLMIITGASSREVKLDPKSLISGVKTFTSGVEIQENLNDEERLHEYSQIRHIKEERYVK